MLARSSTASGWARPGGSGAALWIGVLVFLYQWQVADGVTEWRWCYVRTRFRRRMVAKCEARGSGSRGTQCGPETPPQASWGFCFEGPTQNRTPTMQRRRV